MGNSNPLAMFEILAQGQPALIALRPGVFGREVQYDGSGLRLCPPPPGHPSPTPESKLIGIIEPFEE